MEPHNRPDGPPPPYSETDIYSHSHSSRRGHLSGADDDASIAPSSSHSNNIDTPPESPHDDDDDAQYSFPGPGGDEHVVAASAQDYFDSRPPNRPSGPNVTIVLDITPTSTPADFPYPKQVRDRDVSEQDWQTFINYLIPQHAARANSHIVARKLRMAEDASSPASGGIVEAQLASLKSSASVSVSPQSIDGVTRQWNRGFFEPRGVTIRHTSPTTPAMPAAGAAQAPENDTARASAANGEPAQDPRRQPGGWWRNPFGFADGNSGSLRIGPLHIEGDRVALGSTFEADRNGVRWRGQPDNHPLFEADSRGVRWGGQQPGPSLGHPHPFGRHGGHGGHPWAGPFGGPGRGRRFREHHGHRQRDHSRSSISSSSSSSSASSSDSDSSIGSLPDWDDLKDTQLPVTKRSIQAWLLHPDQPVTRNMLKQAKTEIKAARKVPPLPRDPSWESARENLRREVKDLLQQFKALKKQQRAASRTARKERRQQKRAAKQERRERKRAERHDRRSHDHEGRRAERAIRRGERDADRHARRYRHHHAVPPMGPASGPVPVPPIPSIPAVPPGPHPFHGGFAAGFGRGPFGAHPPPPPPGTGFGFGFGRGFGHFHGRGGWGPSPPPLHHHDVAAAATAAAAVEQANRTAAEAVNAAGQEMEKALATAAQERERALARAQDERERAARTAEEARRAAMEAAGKSHRKAMESHRAAMDAAAEARRAALEEARSRRADLQEARESALLETVAKATREKQRQQQQPNSVDARLAQVCALESQISAKAAQVQALGRDYDGKNGSGDGGSGSGTKTDGDGKESKGGRGADSNLIEQLEEEMERLGRKVEALRLEADEEFARQFAEKEDEWGKWK